MRIPFRRYYYYLVFKYQGRLRVWLIPDAKDESDAHRKASEKLQGVLYDVEKRPYKDTGRVMQESKAKWLDKGDMEVAMAQGRRTPPDDSELEGVEEEL